MPPPPPIHPRGYLPRLPAEFYHGTAVVIWTHTIEDRSTGWLTAPFHQSFREFALHAAVREQLLCPIYTLMPDHLHIIWMGVSKGSDQRPASTFLREQLKPCIVPHVFQHQPHEHVLREHEREHSAFTATCHYVAENPMRAGLVSISDAWHFTGCIVPGYPKLHPLGEDFWDKFWRIYNAAVDRGSIGKIGSPSRTP